MSYINRNEVFREFETLIERDLSKTTDYLPEGFNEQQLHALNLFKQRIFLEEIIDTTITFNKTINFEKINPNLKLTQTAEELINVFKLRSDVFFEVGYAEAFPDTISGLNFDKYDKTSAIVYHENNNEMTGTLRLIFDSEHKLPSESVASFDQYRKEKKIIGELSRNIIKQEKAGLNLEFKHLMSAVHNLFINNKIDLTLSGIKKEHYKLCSRFGGMDIVKELDHYGIIDEECLVISWDPSQASRFFKRAFLNQK